jgi:hypothetical protein
MNQMRRIKCLGLLLMCFALAISGCDEYSDVKGLTAQEYAKRINKSSPSSLVTACDATSIDLRSVWTRDSNEEWWRLSEVAEEKYRELQTSMEAQLTLDGFLMNRSIQGYRPKPCGMPGHWPDFVQSVPDWWSFNGDGAVVTSWEKEMMVGPTIRSYGWFMAYQGEERTVYVCYWNYQHRWLGLTNEQKENAY